MLPTEEGLYQEQYDDGTWGRVWELGDDDKWVALQGDSAEFGRWPLVHLEPRAVTAKAVLDRIWHVLQVDEAMEYDLIAREFGVTT